VVVVSLSQDILKIRQCMLIVLGEGERARACTPTRALTHTHTHSPSPLSPLPLSFLSLPPPQTFLLSNSILSSVYILYSKEGDFDLTSMIVSCIDNLNFVLILTRFYFLICTAHDFFPILYSGGN
jgi:hypothetical protein